MTRSSISVNLLDLRLKYETGGMKYEMVLLFGVFIVLPAFLFFTAAVRKERRRRFLYFLPIRPKFRRFL